MMDFLNEIKSVSGRIKPKLSDRFYVSEIDLFGSIIRDDFGTGSDINILVDFKKPIGIGFIDLADFIDKKIHRKIDSISKVL